jgi:hypothetical protein
MAGLGDVFLVGSVPDDGAHAGSIIRRDRSRKWHCSHRHPTHDDAQLCAELTVLDRDGSQPMPEGWERSWARDWRLPGGRGWRPL